MNIKTITCHDVYNAGASLQAYALMKYLEGLGHNVEIIDYKPDYLKHYKLVGNVSAKYDKPILSQLYQIRKFPERLKAYLGDKKKNYDLFTSKYLKLTQKKYCSYDDLKNDPPLADVFFAGSDQIWNTIFPNGKDPAFYLQFAVENSVRASYAASFATEKIENGFQSQIKTWLASLDFISVREKSAVGIIKDLGINKAVRVADPVFLIKRDIWEELCGKLDLNEKYILLYDFELNADMLAYAKGISKQTGWRVYSILPSDNVDRCFVNNGPLDFISLVNNAEIVISNSFHATAFSFIFERPFVVFERKEKINTRMKDLLSELGLTSRMINAEGGNKGAWKDEIDFEGLRKVLNAQIEASKKYIDMVLESVKH